MGLVGSPPTWGMVTANQCASTTPLIALAQTGTSTGVASARSKVTVTPFLVSSNAGGQQKRTLAQSGQRSRAFRLTGSGPPPKQDKSSHWRRRPHAIRIEPFPSAGRVYTGKQASGGLGLCWSVCGGDNAPSAPTPPPARRPEGRLPRRSSRPSATCGSSPYSGAAFLPRNVRPLRALCFACSRNLSRLSFNSRPRPTTRTAVNRAAPAV